MCNSLSYLNRQFLDGYRKAKKLVLCPQIVLCYIVCKLMNLGGVDGI